jgi:hypothetical protein
LQEITKIFLCMGLLIVLCVLILNFLPTEVVPCLSVQRCKNASSNIECSIHGKCFYDVMGYYLSNKTQSFQNCICDDGWTNLSVDDSVKCCYEKKSQFSAFFLEIAIGFGLGHFYIGDTITGLIKLISCLVLCFGGWIFACYMCYKKEHEVIDEVKTNDERKDEIRIKLRSHPLKYKILNFLVIFSAIAYVIWQIIDAFLFGLNILKDVNGIELKPW